LQKPDSCENFSCDSASAEVRSVATLLKEKSEYACLVVGNVSKLYEVFQTETNKKELTK
jgi:hypothetical protein